MNPRYAIHEEIDRYLNGQMGAAERRAFEEQLASNASVRAEFEAQKVAHELIFEDALLDLKKQMQRDMNGGGSTPPSSTPGKNYRNWLIGLGGGILCLSALYYFFSSGEKGNGTLVAEQNTAPATQQVPAKKEVITSGSTTAPVVAMNKPTAPTGLTPVAPAPQTLTPAISDPAPVSPTASSPAPEHSVVTAPTLSTPKPVEHAPKDPGNANDNPSAEPSPVAPPPGAYTFQPETEGNWTLPYQEGKQGTFRLMSRTGSTVYQTHFSSGTSQQWNGNDAAGVALPAGYYIYLIEYDQGGVEKGSLTILR